MKKVILPVLFLTLFCCKKEKDKNESTNEDYKVFVTNQVYEIGKPPHLIFVAETRRTLECGNYKVLGNVQRNSNEIILNITGLQKPQTCLGQQTASGHFDAFDVPEGNYILTVVNGTASEKGTMRVTSEKYEVEYAGNNKVAFENKTLYKIPPNTLWGEVLYTDAALDGIAQTVEDSLLSYGVQPYAGAQGKYSSFTIGTDNAIVPYNNPGLRERHFIYSYSGSLSKISSLAAHYTPFDSLTVNLYYADGSSFRNHLY